MAWNTPPNTHTHSSHDTNRHQPYTAQLTRTIAHYERINQIGEGTYGQVYKARSHDTQELVALKKIRVLSSSSSSSKKHKSKHKSKNGSIGEPSTYAGLPLTAIREIKILKQLKHPNMVRMLEVVTSKGVEELDDDSMGEEKEEQQQNAADKSSDPDLSDKDNNSDDYLKDDLKHLRYVGNLFLVLEYVPMDLTGLMDMGYRFTHVQAKCLFRQLLQVLEYIHENKYVHRDLKCSNILVDWDFRLKLADFGLARSIRYEPIYKNNPDAVGMSMSEYNAFMSQAGAIFMPPVASGNSNQNPKYTNKVITLWYRPPELLMGERQYGTGVDMWSAGCILAELILGRPILPGKSEMQQLDLIFELIGSPTEPKNNWDVSSLPSVKSKKVDVYEGNPGNLRTRFHERKIPKSAMDLIEKLLTLDPRKRISARGSLLSRYFIMEPKAPEDPSELGKIQIDGKTEKDNFHEFQTKKARKEAKVVAEAARKEAVKLGLSKSEIDDRYHESYRKHMSVAKLNKEPPKVRSPKVRSPKLGKRPEETKDVSKNSKISETEKDTTRVDEPSSKESSRDKRNYGHDDEHQNHRSLDESSTSRRHDNHGNDDRHHREKRESARSHDDRDSRKKKKDSSDSSKKRKKRSKHRSKSRERDSRRSRSRSVSPQGRMPRNKHHRHSGDFDRNRGGSPERGFRKDHRHDRRRSRSPPPPMMRGPSPPRRGRADIGGMRNDGRPYDDHYGPPRDDRAHYGVGGRGGPGPQDDHHRDFRDRDGGYRFRRNDERLPPPLPGDRERRHRHHPSDGRRPFPGDGPPPNMDMMRQPYDDHRRVPPHVGREHRKNERGMPPPNDRNPDDRGRQRMRDDDHRPNSVSMEKERQHRRNQENYHQQHLDNRRYGPGPPRRGDHREMMIGEDERRFRNNRSRRPSLHDARSMEDMRGPPHPERMRPMPHSESRHNDRLSEEMRPRQDYDHYGPAATEGFQPDERSRGSPKKREHEKSRSTKSGNRDRRGREGRR